MRTFIEKYLHNSAAAMNSASASISSNDWMDSIDDEMIYRQLATPEFRLYEEIVLSSVAEYAPGISNCFYAA